MGKLLTAIVGTGSLLIGKAACATALNYNVSSAFASGGKIVGSITLNNSTGRFTAANLSATGFTTSNGNYSVIAIQGPDFISGYDLDIVPPGYGPEIEFVFSPSSFNGYTAATIPVDSLYFNSGIVFNNEFAASTMVTLAPSTVSGVPEPASWATLVLGMGAVGYVTRRRTKITKQAACAA